MLTPKDKAKELIKRFTFSHIYFTNGFDGAKLNAKQCALIAVDEIVEVLDKEGYDDSDWKLKFWQEVEQELENLQ